MSKQTDIKTKDKNKKYCIRGIKLKEGEDDIYTALVATTHPDNVGDILGVSVMNQISTSINNTDVSGGDIGAYRSVSMCHDWIHEEDSSLDQPASLLPNSRVIELDAGHHGVEVDLKLNKFYRGEMSPEEIKSRIDSNAFAGLSIEYQTDQRYTSPVNINGKEYRFVEKLTEFAGSGLARARKIANPKAVFYKEIEKRVMEGKNMPDEKKEEEAKTDVPDEKESTQGNSEEATEKKSEDSDSKKQEEEGEDKKEEKTEEKVEEKEKKEPANAGKLSVKEIIESKEFKDAVDKELQVKSKVIKEKKEDQNMKSISVKEMNAALKEKKYDALTFKEAASRYFAENPEIDAQLKTTGIPLMSKLSVKCDGNKMRIVGQLETKDTLDTGTNTTTYTQSIVEFADLYTPGIVDTFNNATNLYGALRKVDHMMGGSFFGWRITTSQQTSLSVDPDDTTVQKQPVLKLKLRTEIKEYRLGVSVTDYVLHHSRSAIGDLFMIEIEKTSRDLLKDINGDLFTEQVDTAGNQILGLEAVADSAGNTSMYGLTRSTANRLAPDAAGDTYNAVGGALTSALLRTATRKVEVEGALRGNLRYIANPMQRDKLFELEDGNLRYFKKPDLGFNGEIFYDGVPMIIDTDCQTDAIFVVDWESYYIAMSRPPQVIGLAKVGAAEEAYVSTYFAVVYEQPRRIFMLDTLTTF